MNATSEALTAYATGLRQNVIPAMVGTSIDVSVSIDQISNFQSALAAQGFTALPQQEQDLYSLYGGAPDDFNVVLPYLLAIDPTTVPQPMSASISATADVMDQFAQIFSGT